MKRRIAATAASTAVILLMWACSSDNGAVSHPGGKDGGELSDASGDGAAESSVPQKQGDYDLKPNAELPVEECSRTITPVTTGVCGVTTTGAGTARIFQGTLLLPGKTLHKGELVIDNGVVTCAACDCSASAGYATASTVSCPNGVISPGLINTHDHITYLKNGPIPHGTTRYESRQDWRKGNHGATPIDFVSGSSNPLVTYGELRFVMGGATSTAGAGGRVGLLRNLDVLDPSTQQGAPMQAANSDTFPLDDTNGTQNTSGCTYGPGRTTDRSISGLDGYLPHISEGIDVEARNEFLCQSKDDKANGYYDLVKPQTAIIHAIPLVAADADLLHQNQTAVVWSPRTNIDLYGNTAPVTLLDAEGVQIALGTDWIVSGSMNMLRELKCADSLNTSYYDKHFSDSDLWKMTTLNAAYAVGGKSVLGQLSPGYLADIAIFDGSTAKDHRAVLDAGDEDVVLVMRGGKALYGDTALMSDPVIGAAACEDINAGTGEVCGHPKKACVAQDVGDGTTTLASARAVGETYYPLFFCKTAQPTNEPSCVPYRDTYPDGITTADRDGDGISDGADDCPSVFNPVRLMDNGIQSDSDGDGVGDACDRCPLDATNTCTKPDANDSDGDGITNDHDNCPEVVNADQADSDNDGYGNACDDCPTANPGATACVTTVQDIRDPSRPGHVKSGVNVTLTDMYVTAVLPNAGTSRGYFLQAGTDVFSGIAVNTGSRPAGVVVGNKVTITGYYFEDFSFSTINSPTVVITDPGTTLPFAPIAVTTSDIATGGPKAEAYEGMLVQVSAVTDGAPVTITNNLPHGAGLKYDNPVAYDIVITNSLYLGDGAWSRYGHLTTDPIPAPDFANGTVFTSVTGVLDYFYYHEQLWPRNAADVVRP